MLSLDVDVPQYCKQFREFSNIFV